MRKKLAFLTASNFNFPNPKSLLKILEVEGKSFRIFSEPQLLKIIGGYESGKRPDKNCFRYT